MAGKKRKSRRASRMSSDSQLIIDSVEEEATKCASEPTRKGGRRRKTQRRKCQGDPEIPQVLRRSEPELYGRTKQVKDDTIAREPSGAACHDMRETSGHIYADEDNTEGEEEEYHTADEEIEGAEETSKPEDVLILPSYLFDEDHAQENEEMEYEMDPQSQMISSRLELMNVPNGSLGDGETVLSTVANTPDDHQEKPELRCPSPEAHKCVTGSEDQSKIGTDGTEFVVPGLTDLAEENASAPENASPSVESDGSRAEVVHSRPASDECKKAVAKRSSSRFGTWCRNLIVQTIVPKFLLPSDAEVGNIPIFKPQSLEASRETVSDIKLPTPENRMRQKWFLKYSKRFELGTTGYSYDGGIIGQKMHGYGRLMLRDNGDFITGDWDADRLMDLKSCQLHYRNRTFNVVKRFDAHLLTIYETRFLAIVTFNSLDQLDFTKRVEQIKEAFFEKVITLEIVQDELSNKRQDSLHEFESLLSNMTGEHADPIVRANIFKLLKKHSSHYINTQLSDFLNDRNIPPEVRNAANGLQVSELQYRGLNNSFIFLKRRVVQLDIKQIISNIYNSRIEKYREMLIGKCSADLPGLISELRKLDNTKLVYVTREDIDIFDRLAGQPFFQHYEGGLENLVERFGQALNNIPTSFQYFCTNPSSVIPIMCPVLEFLVRSLWEIMSEIIEASDGCYEYDGLLACGSENWTIEENIEWPGEQDNPEEQDHSTQEHGVPRYHGPPADKSSYYRKSLEVQYKLIFNLLKCVFPDSYIVNKKVNYKFRVLRPDPCQENGVWGQVRKLALPERFRGLSEERLVWLFILDHTLHKVFRDEPHYRDLLKRYDPLLQGAIRFIESSPTENHESFRALTHNVLKLVTSSAPYVMITTGEHSVDGELDKLGVDVEILFQQISTASQNIDHDPLAFSIFRDLITENNKYLSLRHFIEIQAAPGHFSTQLSQMMQTFMRIVGTSLKKSVPTTALVAYFRCLNDFLDDFRNIDFLEMWYIKTLGYDNEEAMEKVENKLSTGKNCSFRVTDIEKFVAEYVCLDLPPPHHYIIQIVNELLGCIEKCLDKHWESDDDQLQLVQLKTTGILLDAVRRSFMYLKEQANYVDFKAFKKESVDPFVRLVAECFTLSDLKSRANIVKESFWYLRKMDEIDIDQAIILLKNANTCQVSDQLLNCYNLYLSTYNAYIGTYTSFLSGGKPHAEGLNAVKQMVKQLDPLHFSQWTEQFKNEEIPILLAGISAVWSILVSKDLSSTGKFLKPHCIQILCILRLLSVDQSIGTDNHLAQVLTGQGKSVVLGLLSMILALTGHNVRVLCYSKYLSSRDQNDFSAFFRTFRINKNINYGTFEDMAEEFFNPTCNGRRQSLSQLVEDRVLYHADWSTVGSVTTEAKNAVLLIDEVDVFFTDNFYGNMYCGCVRVKLGGLIPVQEKIWSLAMTKRYTMQEILDHTKAYIREEAEAGKTLLSDLTAFLRKPGTFSLLNSEVGALTVKNYTNQTLFDEHLLIMTSHAISVAKTSEYCHGRAEFMIDGEGRICMRSNDIYSTEWGRWISGYLNVFNYLRLKRSNYDHKNFSNYGYLLLDRGNMSYSLLPSQFRLILGVSGTLNNLSEYEKKGIESYNIKNTTILPSFYGESNLLFDNEKDFHYYTGEHEWSKQIYNKAYAVVQSSRAVMIFFESDLTMGLFTKEYRTKFDRFNEITTNTESHLRDAYIEEAGLPGAVTLATRGMGRGVDYKSSLSVEKHGGVHVIQTFYSTDVKEEIQIKGRTARKDNKGSYEILICKPHLVKEKIITIQDETAHSYATLSDIRQKLSHEKGETVTEKILESERDHKTTMEYFGLV